jgi:hypothetical protein
MGDIKKLYKYLQSRKVQGLGSEDEFKDGFLNDSAFSKRVYDYVKPLFSDIEDTHKAFVDGFREPKNNTAYATPVPYDKKKYYGIGEDYPDWVDKQKQYFGNPPKDIDEAAVGIKKANNMELTPQEKSRERRAKVTEHVNANIGVERYNAYKEAEAQYRAAITSRLDADIERAKADKRAKEEEINKTIPQGSRALALFPQAKMAVQWTIPAYTLDVLEDTKELLEAPTKGSNWAGSMWAGFRDNADIKSFLSLGMSTFAKTGKVYDICSRYTNGEKLTDEETNLLEALAMNTAVAGLRAGDISGWYRSGEVTGDMVEIMGQFLLTGGIGTGASKVVSKAIGKTMQKILPKLVSKMGAKGAVGTVLRGAKFAGKGAVDVVAGGAAQSIYMPSTYSGYWEKKSGTVTHGDKDGEYNIEPSKINDLQAMLSSMAETGTERLGGAFVGAGSKILKNIVPKSWAKLSTKGAIGALIKAGGTANKYMAKAGVNSTMGELSEEFAGAAFDKAIGASSDEEWKAFWSKDNMLQMIGGFAPMSMFGLGMNGATIANKRVSALRSKRRFVNFTRDIGSKNGVDMAEEIISTPIEDLGKKMHKYTQEIGGYTNGELNDNGIEFNRLAAEVLRSSTERDIANEWDSYIQEQEAEDNVNTVSKRTIDDTVDDRVDDTEQTIPQVQQGDEVEYDNARWIVGDVAEEDGEYTFGDESIPLKKGNVLMFEADGNGIRILESTADLYAEDKDNGIESRRQEIYEKYRPVMNVDTGNIIQLSSTADNDNIAYVVKGRVVYDEEGNIDYDKSDDTIYYKVYDKDGNEVDGGTPRPLHLKTHRTEFGKVLSDTPIEEYVDNELYPQDETEQSSATGSVSTDEYQEVTDENGLPFVKTSNGVTDFGYIPEDTGLTPAPIRLSIGDELTGLQHIVDRHGEQIAKAGFDNVVDFVEYVASNYDTITEGVDTSGEPNGTYLLQAKDKHNNTLYVELSNDGSYWNINSGGVFRKGYGEKNKVVWSASEVQRGLKSATPDTLRSQDEADNQGDPNRTVSDTTSTDKGTTNNLNRQEEFYNSLPRNKKGEIDESLMSAEQKIRYAQAEFGEDLDLVKDYITEQSKALSEKIAKLTNKTGKSVAEYKELAALKADKNVFVDYLHSLRDMQEDSMPRQTVEAAAAKREESRREEQAQREQMVREKEEREGVPDFLQDTPEDARLRGFRLRTGERIDRQEPIEVSKYNTARRKFTNDTGAVEEGRPTVKRTIIDNAETRLQPSHRGGRANIYHFITEAQPKERTDKASRVSAAQIAANINPEEITGGITAYNGSPIANNRLEVIQGNNRAEALRLMYEEYPQSAETYKQYLADNAENYGMSADEVRTMKEPIAVDIYEGTDGNAILLGQYTQQDVESGGVHRINPSGVVKHLKSHNMLDRFITGLLKGVDEENTVSDVISANLRDVLPILDKTGAISMTQRQGFFDERGDVTSGAIDDFKGILTSLITEGGYANINSDFLNLPDSAKTALYLQTYRAILNQEYGRQILGEIQDSILLYTLVFGKNNKGKVGADEARREVMSWLMTAQPDFNTLNEDGTYPLVDMRKKFSNFAAELAILYKSTNLRSSKDKGRGLYNIWDDFYNLLEGKGDLFTAGEKKSLQESINENFNIDYVPIRQNERNTLGSRGEASRAGRRGSESELSIGEQSEAGTAAADDRGRAEADIAEAVKDIDVEPTEAQKKAGNYKKGHVKIQGFDITIENPKGAIRRGVDDNGKAWSTEMKNHYGYFKNTEGKDGDHIDVFIGDNPNSKRIFVVDQVNPKTKEFDESKVMLGFDTEDEAKKAYLSNYSKDWKGFKDITYVDIETFRDWLYDGAKQRKPFGEYSNIRFRSIKDINDRFNEELQQQIDGTLPKGHVYSLGMPNDILRSAGLPNLPIEMSAEMLKNKSSAKYRQHHPFDISSIKDLPRAIQNPIAVFNNPNNDGKVLLTELQYNGVNHIVAIKVRSERKSNNIEIDVNSVSTIFPKDRIEKIVEWLLDKENQGRKAYLNKEKVLTWLSDNETITRSKGYNTKDIAKVIKDFDNPTLSEEKNEETRLKASKRKARGATTEKLEELVTLLKKTGFADVKTGEDFYNALAEIGGSEHYLRPNGTVLGFVKGNTIYLNPDEVSLNTPIHEFGHLWVSQVKEHFPDLWAKGKELFLESDYLRKVQADENYRHLDLDGQIDEAMARAIGDRGEQELDKTLLEKILDWIAEVWDKIGGVFGIDNLTSEQISNLTLQDFTDMATSELLSGQNLTERVNGNRGGATRYNTKAKQEKEEIAKRDEIYLEALQRGDMETAIRMVNEAAAQNGYTPNSEYQGTSAFNGKAPYGNGYFLTKEERKEAFENDEFEGDTNLDDYINSGIDPMNLDLLTNDNNYRHSDDARKEAIENLRNVIRNKRQTITMYRSVPSSVKEGSFRNGDWVTPSRAYAVENARIHGWGNKYRIIEQEVPISDVWFDGNDIAEFGYGSESDYINNKDYLYGNTKNNRKLPDVVTYDDKGNIVPLSKRFNKAKSDPRYNTAEETADIKAKAISDGTFMKAPNGKPTNLNERQWLQVRTKAFKKWFGDWEKTARIEKLKKTKPIEITGEEYKGKYELNVKSGHKWILDNLRGTYTIKDTGEKVNLSRVSANEITSHGEREDIHLKSFAVIPQMIENAIFIEETDNYKGNNKYDKYKYYVVGLSVDGVPYTARIVVGEKNGKTYYDHELTQIEKGTIIDSLNGTTTSVAKNDNAFSEYKDKQLFSLLQTNSSKVVDENGEPMVVYHGTNKFGFTVFDKEFSDDKTSIFFTDRVDIAKGYAGVNADVRSLYDDDTTGGYSKDEILSMLFADVDISSHTNGWDVANAILPYLTEDIGITAEYGEEDGVTPEEEIGVLTLSSSYSGDTYRLTDDEFSWEKVENWLRDNADLENVIDKDAGIYGVFVNARNVLDIDAGGSMWSSIPKKKVKGAEGVGNMDTRDIVEHAKKLNYDGVYIKDLLDTGGRGYGLVGDIEGDIFISLVDKNQIKSATDNIGTFDGEDEDIRYSVEGADYFVNERFNEQLEKLTEKNADSTMFRLGYPDMILQSTGIPNKELRLYGNKLLKKAEKHDFNVKDLVDLPTSIQTPMFVFKGNHPDSFSIVTELKIRDKNVLVSIERNKDGEVDFNLISSVYGKSGRGIVHWLNNGKALYVNKEKALDYLRISAPIAEAQDKGELNPSVSTEKALAWQAALAPIASATLKQELITATKIIENFENPPINEKKVIDDTTNDMVRYSIKASEQLDKEDEIMGKKAAEIYEARVKMGKQMNQSDPKKMPNKKIFDEINRKTENIRAKTAEHAADCYLPMKHLIEIFNKHGYNIADYNNWYMNVFALAGKNEAEYEKYQAERSKPLQQVAKAAMDSGNITYRDLENYLILKHGQERNKYYKERDEKLGVKPMKDYSGTEAVMFEEFCKRTGIKVKTIEEDIPTLVDGDPNMIRYDNGKSEFSKDGKKIPDFEVNKRFELWRKQHTPEDIIEDYEEKIGKEKVEDLWSKIRKATQFTLDCQKEGGLTSEKMYEKASGMWEYFVPLRGFDMGTAQDKYDYDLNGITLFTDFRVEQTLGRTRRSVSPLAWTEQMAHITIQQKNKNLLNQSLRRLASVSTARKDNIMFLSKQYKTPDVIENGKVVREGALINPPAHTGNPTEDSAAFERWETSMKEGVKNGTVEVVEHSNVNFGMIVSADKVKQHVVRVYEGGRPVDIIFNTSPSVPRAINGLNNKTVVLNDWFSRQVKAGTRLIAQTMTTYNPAFVGKNLMRDYLFANTMLMGKEDRTYRANFNKNIVKAHSVMFDYVKGKSLLGWAAGDKGSVRDNEYGRWLTEFVMNGGKTGFSQMFKFEKMSSDFKKQTERGDKTIHYGINDYIHFIEAMNDYAENITRFAAYCASRQAGRSIERSISDAKELTINFNRKGIDGGVWGEIRSLCAFSNASIQALVVFSRGVRANPKRLSAIISSYVAMPIAMAIVASLVGGDDYFKLSKYDRQNNICIPMFGGGFIKIPLPQELRVFWKLGDEIALCIYRNEPPEVAAQEVFMGALDLLPSFAAGATSISDVLDEKIGAGELLLAHQPITIIQPITQLMSNRNFLNYRIYDDNKWGGRRKELPEYRKALRNKGGETYSPNFVVKLSEGISRLTGGSDLKRGVVEVNPDIMNHFMRGYFGGLYNTAVAAINVADKGYQSVTTGEWKLKSTDSPTMKAFYVSPSNLRYTDDILNAQYMDVLKEAKKHADVYANYLKEGEVDRFEEETKMTEDEALDWRYLVKGIDKEVQELRNEIATAETPKERDEALRQLETLQREAIDMAAKLKK